MPSLLKTVFWVCTFSALCQTAVADIIFDVTLNTSPLVGHPAGPFYVYGAFTDGSGIGDANNTVTLSNFTFGGGSSLGSPLVFGGASGSLETGVGITDSSFLSFFAEQFAPGLQLSFSLDLTLNDDGGGTPDRFSFFILDSSQVPLPTLAPSGDYFFGVDLHSTGPIFDAYGSDPSRAPSVGNPVSIAAPTITSVNSVPEPSTIYLLGGALAMMAVLRRRLPRSMIR
jgi:PEP-CTERM motif